MPSRFEQTYLSDVHWIRSLLIAWEVYCVTLEPPVYLKEVGAVHISILPDVTAIHMESCFDWMRMRG